MISKARQILSVICEGDIFKEGGYVFTVSMIDQHKIMGTLAYQDQVYNGWVSYNDEEGVNWGFDPALPDGAASDDAWLDLAIGVVSHYNDEITA
jgi:hypothetical protein